MQNGSVPHFVGDGGCDSLGYIVSLREKLPKRRLAKRENCHKEGEVVRIDKSREKLSESTKYQSCRFMYAKMSSFREILKYLFILSLNMQSR